VTHYEVAGPDTAPVVLFASAFSVPGFISDPLFHSLADSGFRVIRFDYYGRGWSDRLDSGTTKTCSCGKWPSCSTR
jgi:pimeloyl-ACP methyl ester carboxylesterase